MNGRVLIIVSLKEDIHDPRVSINMKAKVYVYCLGKGRCICLLLYKYNSIRERIGWEREAYLSTERKIMHVY